MTPLEVALKGIAAGMASALVLTVATVVAQRLTRRARRPATRAPAGLTPGWILREGPSTPPDLVGATATFVQKLATGLFGRSLSRGQQLWAGTAWHLAYGGWWGMLYGIIRASVEVPDVVAGPVWGVVVWLIGPVWLVPKMRLMLSIPQQRLIVAVAVFAAHLAFGTVVAFAFAYMARTA
ncbi:MAG: hypothetical protein M3295_02530 [Chloroflexota bacterium]|nr:hypothetical protein [Chloroflexota bacterium]